MNDTSPAAHKKQLEIIMSKTPQERFMMGIEMMDSVYAIVKKSILQQNPDISSDELQVILFVPKTISYFDKYALIIQVKNPCDSSV